MDGFSQNTGIIVIGATNFPDVLDKALTRPGRFDKQVQVPLPDVKGREEILQLYGSKTKLAPGANLKALAQGTPGMSGADLSNLVNQVSFCAGIREVGADVAERLWCQLASRSCRCFVIVCLFCRCEQTCECGDMHWGAALFSCRPGNLRASSQLRIHDPPPGFLQLLVRYLLHIPG